LLQAEFDSMFNKGFRIALKRAYHNIPVPSDEQIQVSWKGIIKKLDLEQNIINTTNLDSHSLGIIS
jgi:hypothetical protein